MRGLVLAILIFGLTCSAAMADEWGTFVGKVKVEWLEDGRRMQLLEPFAYIDPDGLEWNAPVGTVVDGASIPKPAWSIIGGPFEGRYRNASVIHDVGCDERRQPWDRVHLAFYNAMRAAGVSKLKAIIMYGAVYHFGPRWPHVVTVKAITGGTARSDVESLERSVLKDYARGSRIELVEVRHRPGDQGFIDSAEVEARFRVLPPAEEVAPESWETLVDWVESNERRGGDVSLEEIRRWRDQ